MAEVVNLRQHRKRKARAAQDVLAAQNRASFGRTKAARETTKRERAQAAEHLEGHRLEPDPREDGAP